MWCHAERNTKDKNDSIGQEKGAFLSKFKVATDPFDFFDFGSAKRVPSRSKRGGKRS
jgi:hypothetical protein